MLTIVLLAAVALVPWSRFPPSYALVIPFGSLLVIALLRDGVGGATSGYGVLVLAPVLWLALYASRRALILLLVCVAVTLAAPILIAGEPHYPASEWRRVVLITAISAVVGLTTQALVNEVRARAARERRRESYIRAVMNSASEGIVAIDVDGHVTFANRAAARLTGYSIEEMAGAQIALPPPPQPRGRNPLSDRALPDDADGGEGRRSRSSPARSTGTRTAPRSRSSTARRR